MLSEQYWGHEYTNAQRAADYKKSLESHFDRNVLMTGNPAANLGVSHFSVML